MEAPSTRGNLDRWGQFTFWGASIGNRLTHALAKGWAWVRSWSIDVEMTLSLHLPRHHPRMKHLGDKGNKFAVGAEKVGAHYSHEAVRSAPAARLLKALCPPFLGDVPLELPLEPSRIQTALLSP